MGGSLEVVGNYSRSGRGLKISLDPGMPPGSFPTDVDEGRS